MARPGLRQGRLRPIGRERLRRFASRGYLTIHEDGDVLMTGRGREARIHYLAGTFRILATGDYVRCAVTGAAIAIDELLYWSVERQEAYVDAAASLDAERRSASAD